MRAILIINTVSWASHTVLIWSPTYEKITSLASPTYAVTSISHAQAVYKISYKRAADF